MRVIHLTKSYGGKDRKYREVSRLRYVLVGTKLWDQVSKIVEPNPNLIYLILHLYERDHRRWRTTPPRAAATSVRDEPAVQHQAGGAIVPLLKNAGAGRRVLDSSSSAGPMVTALPFDGDHY